MELKTIWAVYYSATGTTAKMVRTVAEALAERLNLPLEERSFTRPGERAEVLRFSKEDLVVVGSPTYAGRLPNKILPDFQEKLRGNGALAVPIVLFGNRSYDNSLAERRSVLEADGFCPMAAAWPAGCFGDKPPFIAVKHEGLVKFSDIPQNHGGFTEKILKCHEQLMPHVKSSLMCEPECFLSMTQGIVLQCLP